MCRSSVTGGPSCRGGGASPKKIQARLGHASITETMDTYGHLYPDDDTSVREVIESAFDDAMLPRQAAGQPFTRQEAKS